MTDRPDTPNGQPRTVTVHVDTPNDAAMWLDAVPAGWRVLASEVHDLRGIPGGRVVVEATVIPAPYSVADVKGMFAAHGLNVDPIGPAAPDNPRRTL